MGTFWRDIRFAARTLAKSPGFTAVALLTLAVGVGANTAIFSVVNAVLLRSLPYREPQSLVRVYQTQPSRGVLNNGVSFPNYEDWAGRARSFEGLAAIRLHSYTLTGKGEPALLTAATVTSNLFEVLGARPKLGRALAAADDLPGAAPVAVLGEALWRERFGADPAAVGSVIRLDERPFTVVGILPASFRTPPAYPEAQLWTPIAQDPVFADLRERRRGHYLTIVGRLRSGPARRGTAELARSASLRAARLGLADGGPARRILGDRESRRKRWRRLLVSADHFYFVLLVGAGLLGRSSPLQDVRLGFDARAFSRPACPSPHAVPRPDQWKTSTPGSSSG